MNVIVELWVAALLLAAGPGPVAAVPGTLSTAPSYTQILSQATAAREANRLTEAIPLYDNLVRLRPSDAENWWYLATLLYDVDRYTEARDAFRKLVALVPGNGAGLALLGLCEFQTKEYPAAGTHLEQALQMGLPNQPQLAEVVHYHFALLLNKIGEFERASAELFNSARAGQDDTATVIATGIAALRMPLMPSELPPPDRDLVLQAGRAVFDLVARKAAIASKEMDDLVARYPSAPNVHYVYGSYLMFSDPDRALKEFERELQISARHIPARVGLIVEYLKRGDAKAAMPYAKAAVEIEPKNFVTHTLYGRTLVQSGELQPGITELELAAKLAPNSPQTRVALATAYAKAGRKEDAARERAVFLKLNDQGKPGENSETR